MCGSKGSPRLASGHPLGKGAGGADYSPATLFAGVHLAQNGPDNPSVVALLVGDGSPPDIKICRTNEEIAGACDGASVVLIDAPLAVPNENGKRPLEEIMAWCDVSLFPVSRARLTRMYGDVRGPGLAAILAGPVRLVAEHAPALTLRQLLWEQGNLPGAPAIDLGVYRSLWARIDVPRIDSRRPGAGAVGRAREILQEAVPSLSEIVDVDAGTVAALSGAYSARRFADPTLGPSLTLGDAESGLLVGPADANLIDRAALHVERLRADRSS